MMTAAGGTGPVFDTPAPIQVLVDMGYANVEIRASERTDTVVEVRPSDRTDDTDVYAAEHTEIEYDDGRLLVKAAKEGPAPPSGWGGALNALLESPTKWARSLIGWGGSVEVMIELPAGSHVEVRTQAEVRCRGHLAEVRLSTSDGDIRVERADRLWLRTTTGGIAVTHSAGHADITTAHGDIRVAKINGPAVIKNSHGEITIGEVTGELRLNSAYGDIAVERALGGAAAKTAYGNLRIGQVTSGSVVMETTGGGLELGIREGTSAWLDVSSQYGTVDVSLDADDGPPASAETVEVRAHTTYGDIRIHRS